jgi:hypothetical protein
MRNRILEILETKVQKVLLFTIILGFACASCTRRVYVIKKVPVHAKKIPPGQAKKMTGSKSAKPYAPGQQKKH